jgi:hypothetical protein
MTETPPVRRPRDEPGPVPGDDIDAPPSNPDGGGRIGRRSEHGWSAEDLPQLSGFEPARRGTEAPR